MGEKDFIITAPHFVASFSIDTLFHTVIKAAPIIKYMQTQRWTLELVWEYCESKNWKLESLSNVDGKKEVAGERDRREDKGKVQIPLKS